MVTRTAMLPYYRNDAMHLERLHWEAAVDRTPERIAAELRSWEKLSDPGKLENGLQVCFLPAFAHAK